MSRAAEIIRAGRWPFVVLAVLVMFRCPLSNLIERAASVKVHASTKGLDLAVEQQRLEATANLAAATATRPLIDKKQQPPKIDAASIVNAVNAATMSETAQRRAQSVLWVDDHPEWNKYEHGALEALGITVHDVKSTAEAMAAFRREQFGAVISDVKRGTNKAAGYELLDAIHREWPTVPVIFYSASATPQSIDEAKRRGAFGETNEPATLVRLVAAALGESDPRDKRAYRSK